MRIALAACETLPELFKDDQILAEALRRRGAEVTPLVWTRPEAQDACFDLCVLRCTWDYYLKPAEFLDWVEGMAQRSQLVNPLDLVRWNVHKDYLLHLAARKVPSVPTFRVKQGKSMDIATLGAATGWPEVVVKPAISAGAHRTARFQVGDPAAQAHLQALAQDGDALIQPYLPGVEDPGEHSLVYIAGEFTHAVKRTQALTEGVGIDRLMERIEPTEAELEVARLVLEALPAEPTYVRIDLVPGLQGTPVVMEVEALEPRLFLQECPEAAEKLADALMSL